MGEGRTGGVALVIVGSIGLDTVATPETRREDLLGGSVSYAAVAASYLARVGMVGVVGSDFPAAHRQLYRARGIDTEGLEEAPGKTFRWSGVYEDDMINRRTLLTELNVFADFSPRLPEKYRQARFFLLGNISPELQLRVLSQARQAEFVAADTMDLWIQTGRNALMDVIRRVDMLTLNDSEARLLAQEHGLLRCAARIRSWGPRHVVIKKGEHGGILLSPEGVFLIPAYPVETVCDPTGAGDVFAGAMMSVLAGEGTVNPRTLRLAAVRGAVMASFGVEAFGLDRFRTLAETEIAARTAEMQNMIRIE